MNLIRAESKRELEKLLKLNAIKPDNTIFAIVSGIINPRTNLIPGEYTVYQYDVIRPTTMITQSYLNYGLTEEYVEMYSRQLSAPDVFFHINESIYHMIEGDKNLIFVCAEDEEEFSYLKLLGEFIENIYGIKMISFKKYYKGKSSKITKSIEDIISICETNRTDTINKLDDLNIKLPPTLFIRITKELLKRFPKHLRKKYKNYIIDD